jgi:hypothetical protein
MVAGRTDRTSIPSPVGADSPPGTGTGRRALTQMEQRRRRYAAVPCSRRVWTLPGSGQLAG